MTLSDTSHAVDAVVLLRPAAITHHFDSDARYSELFFSYTPSGSGVETLVVTPPAVDEVPPGYYMLFVIERDGTPTVLGHRVPSVAQFVRLK